MLFVVLSAPLALSCQQLDPNLATGPLARSGGSGGAAGPIDGGQVDLASPSEPCAARRTEAFGVLMTNCALCHQAPGSPSLYQGSFSFILDLAQLTSNTSPQSSTTLTLKYVVKGHPEQSYIYQRMSNNSMPPATRTQRPSASDIEAINQWITNCIDDPGSPAGWGSAGGVDGGDGDAGSAPMLPACGPANVCSNGECCVFSRCRPNGTTCGSLPSPIAGEPDLPGLSGTCNMGSCMTQSGASCGKVNEPCCDLSTCTASQSSCLINTTVCSACGGTGQPCCKPNGCLSGRACLNGGVGRVGTCQLCGGLGLPCCGSGLAAQQTCDGALVCLSVAGMGNLCSSDPGLGGVDGGPPGTVDAGADGG
jgi:predicted DNA-binding transcriptional regulator AlpA